MSKKILIIGYGFIGHAVLKLLDNMECHLISRGDNCEAISEYKNIYFQQCDINDIELVNKILKKESFSHLLFLAWQSSPPHNKIQHSTFAAQAIRLCKEFVTINNNGRIIFIGSTYEAGISSGIIPNSFDSINTKHKVLYGISKKFVWDCLNSLKIKNLCWLRLANVYGYGDHAQKILPRIIASAIKKNYIKFNNPKGFVEFVHVSDVARGISLAINSTYNGVINLGSGNGYYLTDIENFIHKLLFNKNDLDRIPAYKYSTHGPILDIELSKTVLGYTTNIVIEKGLSELVELYDRN